MAASKDFVKNELGHTEYPKWIDHPSAKTPTGFPKKVLVKDPDDEAKALGGADWKKPK